MRASQASPSEHSIHWPHFLMCCCCYAQIMRTSLALLVSCCLLVCTWGVAAQVTNPMSAGVLVSGTPVSIAMVCPSGYKLSQVVAAMATTDGSKFTYSSGTSLPLATDDAASSTTSQNYIATPTGSYYIRYTCTSNSNGYCAVQFSIGFYCKSQSSKYALSPLACGFSEVCNVKVTVHNDSLSLLIVCASFVFQTRTIFGTQAPTLDPTTRAPRPVAMPISKTTRLRSASRPVIPICGSTWTRPLFRRVLCRA